MIKINIKPHVSSSYPSESLEADNDFGESVEILLKLKEKVWKTIKWHKFLLSTKVNGAWNEMFTDNIEEKC